MQINRKNRALMVGGIVIGAIFLLVAIAAATIATGHAAAKQHGTEQQS
ncbi:hypothetical protein LJC55_01745 [Eubacteriales bacterium OttesenSCG-928-N14]|nr:hypothetical protein [Eubacteriales bacterium OttesenSCG-928-N14]